MTNVNGYHLVQIRRLAQQYDIAKNGHMSPLEYITRRWYDEDQRSFDTYDELKDYVEHLWGIVLDIQIIRKESSDE